MNPKRVIQIGEKFGRLTVLSELLERRNGSRVYECVCICGNKTQKSANHLRHGNSKSCGCLQLEYMSTKRSKDPGYSTWMTLFNSYKKSAQYRKINWKLSFFEFKSLCEKNCSYCNMKPIVKNKYSGPVLKKKYSHLIERSNILSNGIDRVNNEQGYFLENCVSCCGQCNLAKRSLSKEEFLKWIKRISEFQFGTK